MIAYVETRLSKSQYQTPEFVFYKTRTPEAAVAEVFVRRTVFEGDPPHEIILTVTPA